MSALVASPVHPLPDPQPRRALGLDAGGTHTRWALAQADTLGTVSGITQGQAEPLSGLQLDTEAGRQQAQGTLRQIAQAVGPVDALAAGITGFDAAQQPALAALVKQALGLGPPALRLMNDVELLARAVAPAAVLVAGTGSVAAFVDDQGEVQRAGGRGALLDDAGGGHWIATRALRAVWRAEDAVPGAGQGSPMARALFARLGGADWAATRSGVYGATRGAVGRLALAVAEVADADPAAHALLQRAGVELARLVQALTARGAPSTWCLAGRVFDLHPVVAQSLAQSLPTSLRWQRLAQPPQVLAAQWALRVGVGLPTAPGPT